MHEPIFPQEAETQKKPFLHGFSTMLLLFSVMLFALLLLSWAFVLPRFTRVQVGDAYLTPRAVRVEEKRLTAALLEAEETRQRFILPHQEPLYTYLKEQKAGRPFLPDLERDLREAAARTGEADALVFERMAVSGDGTVDLQGDVRGVGPRSMTLLAAFVEEVESLPHITALKRPAFVREQDATGAFHSPFSFSFRVASRIDPQP